MVNAFKLFPKDFNYLEIECPVVKITKSNYMEYDDQIRNSIILFNNEIQWSRMYTYDDAIKRIVNDNILYLFMYNSEILGHVWFKDYLDGRFLYNLFVRNKDLIKKYKGKEIVSSLIHQYENGKIIYSYVDDWNAKSINLFKRLGFNLL